MSSVVGTWRAWWGGGGGDGGQDSDQEKSGSDEKSTDQDKQTTGQQQDDKKKDERQSASAWAKGFGDLVQSVGSYATTITETVKTKVTETASGTIVGEFQRQQEQFAREQQRQRDAAVPPWVGYNEEEEMRAQILELSADSRNVLRDPPPGVEFTFDYKHSAPVAMATMSEDHRLKSLRFDLVPKKISEEMFWRNYFYRVSLIKQSLQLSTLATAEAPASTSIATTSTEPHPLDDTPRDEHQNPSETSDHDVSTEEFASDQPYNADAVSKEAVQSELNQLGVIGGDREEGSVEDAWEAELQADLEGLDLATAGEGDGLAGEDWEHELQEMLDLHTDQPPS